MTNKPNARDIFNEALENVPRERRMVHEEAVGDARCHLPPGGRTGPLVA